MIQSTLLYITREDGMTLMLYRNKKPQDPNAGKWIGIGGKLEAGETPEEGMRREAWEETGLTLPDLMYRGIVRFENTKYETEEMHLFTAQRTEGVLTECDEGTLRWLTEAEFAALPQWEGDRIFLRLLKKKEPFFFLTLQYDGDRLLHAILADKGEIQ